MSGNKQIRIDEVKGPLVESFKKKNQQYYPTGLIKVFPSGCTFFSEYRKHVEKIRHLEVLPDDVWIVTYPKCGTTWTQEMVWLLMNDLDFDKAKNIKLIDRSPFVEFACMLSPSEREVLEIEDTVQQVERLKSPRCIKSHLPLDLLPEQLWINLPAVVERTANFLNRPINPDELHQLCNHISFGNMRKNPMINIEAEMFKIDRGKVEGKVEPFIRKGQVGGWRSDITPQLAEKIDKWTVEKLKGTDYVVGI
ncbi:hypothetical protein C0J52_08333 [Blattella germanica]|nr:hypothetical protein C0J52_08333 [Blattella germanica]